LILKKFTSMAGLIFSKRALGGMIPFSKITVVVSSYIRTSRHVKMALTDRLDQACKGASPFKMPDICLHGSTKNY
jgi:hypothetical protein